MKYLLLAIFTTCNIFFVYIYAQIYLLKHIYKKKQHKTNTRVNDLSLLFPVLQALFLKYTNIYLSSHAFKTNESSSYASKQQQRPQHVKFNQCQLQSSFGNFDKGLRNTNMKISTNVQQITEDVSDIISAITRNSFIAVSQRQTQSISTALSFLKC